MSVVTVAFYERLVGDGPLAALLSVYGGLPAIFTIDPAPGDAVLPYLVTAGEVVQLSLDTKTTRGRMLTRDVRCYAADNGSVVVVEAMAERVRSLLHRYELVIDGFTTVIAECGGPIVADEQDAYGRIVSVTLKIQGD